MVFICTNRKKLDKERLRVLREHGAMRTKAAPSVIESQRTCLLWREEKDIIGSVKIQVMGKIAKPMLFEDFDYRITRVRFAIFASKRGNMRREMKIYQPE